MCATFHRPRNGSMTNGVRSCHEQEQRGSLSYTVDQRFRGNSDAFLKFFGFSILLKINSTSTGSAVVLKVSPFLKCLGGITESWAFLLHVLVSNWSVGGWRLTQQALQWQMITQKSPAAALFCSFGDTLGDMAPYSEFVCLFLLL